MLAAEDTSDVEDTLYFDDTDDESSGDSAVPDPTAGDTDVRGRPYHVGRVTDTTPRDENLPVCKRRDKEARNIGAYGSAICLLTYMVILLPVHALLMGLNTM